MRVECQSNVFLLKKKIDSEGGRRHSELTEWLLIYGMNFLVLPYFAVIWAFSQYAGVLQTPWTIGWIILWLIYSPIVFWTGVYVYVFARWFTTFCLAALIVAVPFWPDAIWMLLTMFVSAMLGAIFQLWISIAVFVAIVCGIVIWYHGGIPL